MKQRTINDTITLTGIGLHTGMPVHMTLEPLGDNSGIIFYRSDKGVSIPLTTENVVDTKMATVIGKDGVTVSTIEHLLSAIYAYGIDNLRVVLDNNEVPILDGSSSGYCALLDEVGIKEQNSLKKVLHIKKTIEIKDGNRYVKLTPSDNIVYNFTIDFEHPSIGKEHYSFDYTVLQYKEQISKARTFGFLHEVQYLRSKGLAMGASMENAIVLDDEKILNPEGLRYHDEFVRHKILDAIGDMALIGYTIIGEYDAVAGSHHLNHLLTKELLKSKENYEIIDLEEVISHKKTLEVAYAKAKG
ncbi:MAG: UDP-3-O-[3-hydroxymyristoyl] N-acetylglucosamine deacetylase [Campylobacteraceae bacterium 4484_166]|nr:MAG: UDP-3-O-[3-hydroxymyristoyl] N-acetylglucosamine deacetylase [Campylobacteraceae bacterium 4484_166]